MRHSLTPASSSSLSSIPKDERQRLALTLHHSTVQSLAALAMNLDIVEQRATRLDPRARRILEESRALASECFHEVLTLVDALYPPLLDEVGGGPVTS